MFQDRAYKALQAAAAPTLERIRRDRERAPHRLKPLLAYLEVDLFHPDLTANLAWRKAGIRDHSLSTEFRHLTGKTLKPYYTDARMEVAQALVLGTKLGVGQISLVLGYERYETFADNFKRATGKMPRAARLERTAGKSAGSAEAAADVPEPEIEVEPGVYMRARAEEVWQAIRALSPEEQEHQVRRYRFHTTALFDLLRERSRKEGRLDRKRGIQLAELALVSLDNAAVVFGERIHDLRALGWAWVGNAHVLALDFSEASAAFKKAHAEWGMPRERRDQLVLATICNLDGTMQMFQWRYDQALALADRAREVFRQETNPEGEARALLLRSSILIYAGRPEEGIPFLEKAERLLAGCEQPYLLYTAVANQANAYLRTGDFLTALERLSQAKQYNTRAEHPLGSFEILAVEGFIRHGLGEVHTAEELCLQARSGFAAAGEMFSVALIDLELALLYTEQDEWVKALAFSSEATPLLERLRLHGETLAAVGLLAGALKAGHVTPQVLKDVRECLERDPLAHLAPPVRAGSAAGPLRF